MIQVTFQLADVAAAAALFAKLTGTEMAAATVTAAPGKPSNAEKPAAAPSAPAGDAVDYPTLQKAVLALHKLDPSAAVPIAKSLGADTFKLLKPEQWGEALNLVNTAIAERTTKAA